MKSVLISVSLLVAVAVAVSLPRAEASPAATANASKPSKAKASEKQPGPVRRMFRRAKSSLRFEKKSKLIGSSETRLSGRMSVARKALEQFEKTAKGNLSPVGQNALGQELPALTSWKSGSMSFVERAKSTGIILKHAQTGRAFEVWQGKGWFVSHDTDKNSGYATVDFRSTINPAKLGEYAKKAGGEFANIPSELLTEVHAIRWRAGQGNTYALLGGMKGTVTFYNASGTQLRSASGSEFKVMEGSSKQAMLKFAQKLGSRVERVHVISHADVREVGPASNFVNPRSGSKVFPLSEKKLSGSARRGIAAFQKTGGGFLSPMGQEALSHELAGLKFWGSGSMTISNYPKGALLRATTASKDKKITISQGRGWLETISVDKSRNSVSVDMRVRINGDKLVKHAKATGGDFAQASGNVLRTVRAMRWEAYKNPAKGSAEPTGSITFYNAYGSRIHSEGVRGKLVQVKQGATRAEALNLAKTLGASLP